jgi:hypothetical protein
MNNRRIRLFQIIYVIQKKKKEKNDKSQWSKIIIDDVIQEIEKEIGQQYILIFIEF